MLIEIMINCSLFIKKFIELNGKLNILSCIMIFINMNSLNMMNIMNILVYYYDYNELYYYYDELYYYYDEFYYYYHLNYPSPSIIPQHLPPN